MVEFSMQLDGRASRVDRLGSDWRSGDGRRLRLFVGSELA